jgi:aspartokinase
MLIHTCIHGGEKMPASKAQIRAHNKWTKENYERINITVPKRSKDLIKNYILSSGESISAFVNRLIAQEMGIENDPTSSYENTDLPRKKPTIQLPTSKKTENLDI